jgi:hypothetical protein
MQNLATAAFAEITPGGLAVPESSSKAEYLWVIAIFAN